MLLGRDPGEPPERLLSIEQVRGCGDDPLFLSQIHILIFKAINFVSAYKNPHPGRRSCQKRDVAKALWRGRRMLFDFTPAALAIFFATS